MYPILKDRICQYVAVCLWVYLLFIPAQSLSAQSDGKESGTTVKKFLTKGIHETYTKLPHGVQRVLRTSVVFSITMNGYKATKETYYRNVRGQQAHPSMVLARAVIGFAGCCAAALFFGKIFFLIFWGIPFVGRFLGPVMAVVGVAGGCLAGTIGAEWLFEAIMPLQGAGSRAKNALFGGGLGGIVGAAAGVLMDLSFALDQKGGFSGFVRSLVPEIVGALTGLFYGFLLGALAGATAFFYIFL